MSELVMIRSLSGITCGWMKSEKPMATGERAPSSIVRCTLPLASGVAVISA